MHSTADVAKPDTYIVLRNAKIDMFRGSMRLTVNQGGKVEHADSTTDFKVKVCALYGCIPGPSQ